MFTLTRAAIGCRSTFAGNFKTVRKACNAAVRYLTECEPLPEFARYSVYPTMADELVDWREGPSLFESGPTPGKPIAVIKGLPDNRGTQVVFAEDTNVTYKII